MLAIRVPDEHCRWAPITALHSTLLGDAFGTTWALRLAETSVSRETEWNAQWIGAGAASWRSFLALRTTVLSGSATSVPMLTPAIGWAAVHAEGMCASLVDGCCPRLRRVFGTHRASYRVLPREFSPRNDLITVDVRWCT